MSTQLAAPGTASSSLHRQRSVMGGAQAGRAAGPSGARLAGTQAPRQRRRAAAQAAWGNQEPPKELSKDPEAKFRRWVPRIVPAP